MTFIVKCNIILKIIICKTHCSLLKKYAMQKNQKFPKGFFIELLKTFTELNQQVFTHVPKWILIFYILAVLLGSVVSFLFRYVELKLVNQFQLGIQEGIVAILVVYVVMRTLPTIISEIENRLSHRIGNLVVLTFRSRLLFKKSNLDVAYFENSQFHDELQNAEKGISVSDSLFTKQIECINALFATLLGLIAISFIGWKYVLAIVIFTTPSVVNMFIGSSTIYNHTNTQRTENRTKNYFFGLFGIGSIADLKIFQTEKYFISRWYQLARNIQEKEMVVYDRLALVRLVLVLFSAIGVGWVIYSVVMQSITNNTPVGTMLFALGGIAMARTSLFQFARMFSNAVDDLRFVRDYFKVLNAQSLITNTGTIKISAQQGIEIEFQNVSFRYRPEGPDVLKNISFKIIAGQKIGIVGINGAGKSTIMNLMMRFYDPTEGKILVNGHDLKDVDLDTYRANIGFITQKVQLPKAHTIREIIELGAFGKDGKNGYLSWDDVLKHSGVVDFLPQMKNGINQVIGKEYPDGAQLSGGQEQRIAIARVLYRNPMMYIFDEPTSNFDPLIEDRFFTAFNALPKQSTSFLISHSLRIVRNADVILVFNKGIIREQGTHLELIRKNGMYAKMFYVQSRDYIRECVSA